MPTPSGKPKAGDRVRFRGQDGTVESRTDGATGHLKVKFDSRPQPVYIGEYMFWLERGELVILNTEKQFKGFRHTMETGNTGDHTIAVMLSAVVHTHLTLPLQVQKVRVEHMPKGTWIFRERGKVVEVDFEPDPGVPLTQRRPPWSNAMRRSK